MKKNSKKLYPSWTCHECATNAGGSMPPGHLATWHIDNCDICNIAKPVTQPRDYRYPDYDKKVFDNVRHD